MEVANNHHWRLKARNWRKTKPCCHVEVVIHRHISLLAHARKGPAFSIRTAPPFHLSSKITNFKCSSIVCLLASSVGVELIIIYINHHLSACEVRSYYVVLCKHIFRVTFCLQMIRTSVTLLLLVYPTSCWSWVMFRLLMSCDKMYSCTIHKLKYSLYLQVIHLSSFWLQRSSYQFFFI